MAMNFRTISKRKHFKCFICDIEIKGSQKSVKKHWNSRKHRKTMVIANKMKMIKEGVKIEE
jgi:hypothetical protein